MSEAEQVAEEVVQDAPQAEVTPTNDDKPAGYHPVEVEDPAIKDRINYLYKQVKSSSKDINQYRNLVAEQGRMIDELTANQGAIVGHLQNKTYNDTEAQVKAAYKTAVETGDVQGMMDGADKLAEIKSAKAVAKALSQTSQRQQSRTTQYQAPYADVSEATAEGLAEGNLSPDEANLTLAWAKETNERGEPVRPWIRNSTGDPNDPDPDYVKAWVVANKVFNDPKAQNWTINQKLAEVDKRMGLGKETSKQSVMGGALTGKPKAASISLSPEAEKIAVRTKFGANKGAKSDAEYIAAYRKQIQSIKTPTRSAK